MGIGGRLIAAGGGSTRGRSVKPKVIKQKVIRRFKPHTKPIRKKPQPSPPRDPSPQMFNQPLIPERTTEKLVWKRPEPEPLAAAVPALIADPGAWFKAQWNKVVKPAAVGVSVSPPFWEDQL